MNTDSIAWAIHGKNFTRKNLYNYKLVGNVLDKLFQNANDGCTNGVPIGPVASDIISEIIAAAVDTIFSEQVLKKKIKCQAVRFKDDYRILTKSEADAKAVIKILQFGKGDQSFADAWNASNEVISKNHRNSGIHL